MASISSNTKASTQSDHSDKECKNKSDEPGNSAHNMKVQHAPSPFIGSPLSCGALPNLQLSMRVLKPTYTEEQFIPAEVFEGSRAGYVYKLDNLGLGYYEENYWPSDCGKTFKSNGAVTPGQRLVRNPFIVRDNVPLESNRPSNSNVSNSTQSKPHLTNAEILRSVVSSHQDKCVLNCCLASERDHSGATRNFFEN